MSLYTFLADVSIGELEFYGRWVAVREDLDEHVSESGLATNVNKKATTEGRVLAVGVAVAEDLRAGDLVLYEAWMGGRWQIGDERCLIMDIENVLMVLEREG